MREEQWMNESKRKLQKEMEPKRENSGHSLNSQREKTRRECLKMLTERSKKKKKKVRHRA